MESTIKQPPAFSEAEMALLIELLEREQRDLPAEIHHTRSTDYRDQLRSRLEMVNRMLQELRR